MSRTIRQICPEATSRDQKRSDIARVASVENRRRRAPITCLSSKANKSSSSRHIAFALVTLSWSSLNGPFRSILNGFYYLAAIVSLLLLLAYFHQAKAQQVGQKMLQARPTGSLEAGGTNELERPDRARTRLRPRPRPKPRHAPRTSSITNPMMADTKTAKRPSETTTGSATTRLAPVSAGTRSATGTGTRTRQTPPERLTFRHNSVQDDSGRPSSPANQTQPLLTSASQWRPIERPSARGPPQTAPLSGSPTSQPPARYTLRAAPPGGQLDQRPDHMHRSMSEVRGSWRRARLNQQAGAGGYRQSKMYKRVLICDKTLVSLDYVRDFGAEPRPFPMAHYSFDHSSPLDFLDDNSIDLDLNPGPGDLLHRRASTPTGSFTNSTSISTGTTAPTSTSTSASAAAAAAAAASSITTTALPDDLATGNSAPARRSGYQYGLLPDDDALVKCDMWDLEKGLKNRKPPGDILDLAVKADFDTVRDAINRCRQLSEKTLPPDDEYRDGLEIMSSEDIVSLFSMKRGLLPGTKWCGLGDQASTYNDLGPKHRIDICCRAHDHCPIRLKPFRNDYGVLNIALYTKSHCDCDADFYRCLREAHSRTADMLGNLYFNVMKLQCIREERLKVCREVRPIALGFERCVRYEENPMRRVFKFTTPPVAY